MKTEMSLHRILAEIKAIEARMTAIGSTAYMFTATGTAEDAVHIAESQRQFDKAQSAITNLAALKAARNKANATVQITIGGKQMTIDEALGMKAAVPHKQALINALQIQFANCQRAVDTANQQIETRITQQIATMFGASRKATDDEVKLIRLTVEAGLKVRILAAAGLKDTLEALKDEVVAFTTEVDYVLSEANATNKVEVDMV